MSMGINEEQQSLFKSFKGFTIQILPASGRHYHSPYPVLDVAYSDGQ